MHPPEPITSQGQGARFRTPGMSQPHLATQLQHVWSRHPRRDHLAFCAWGTWVSQRGPAYWRDELLAVSLEGHPDLTHVKQNVMSQVSQGQGGSTKQLLESKDTSVMARCWCKMGSPREVLFGRNAKRSQRAPISIRRSILRDSNCT